MSGTLFRSVGLVAIQRTPRFVMIQVDDIV